MDFANAATRTLEPDKKLSVIVGDAPRTRNDIIRKFWDYINERGLQDTDRRMINADRDLQEVLGGKKQVNIFQVTTLLSKHMKKPGKKTAAKKAADAKAEAAAKAAAKAAPKAAPRKAAAPKAVAATAPQKAAKKKPATKK
jgi:chromatin remodeling complex protein RSC6